MKTKRSSSLQKCLAPIPPFIFWPKEMMQFLAEHRREWGMSGLNTVQLLNNLLQENLIVEAEFRSSKYAAIVRYLWGDHSREELALSLQRDSFLSHGSALAVHGIIMPGSVVYVNREQTAKYRPDHEITQQGIRLAFRNKQRQSKYIFSRSSVNYMLLNGKHTNRAGVTRTRTQWGHEVDATDKERTLIDIVVRPAYAGGIQQVADAYVKEARRINVDYMVDLLRQLDHAYPYNQAIGFLLERAGLSGTDCHKFETSGMELDFYLDYGMKEPTFSKKWHLYYPAYLGERTN